MKYKDGKKEIETDVQQKYGDTNYLKLYGLKLMAGTNLTTTDTVNAFIINETYARILGFQQPQQAIGKYDSPVSTYAFEAQHAEFLNHASWSVPGSYDEVLLQPLRDALGDSNRDLFIVLHMMGSHQRYDYRYTAAYKHFRPTESDPAGDVPPGEHIRNGYDNSILYSDHVLASIIGILRDSNAVTALWYESDHGESLKTSTCNMEGHGHGTHWEYEISALSWYSDAYASEFPARVAALRSNARKRTLSADTFESLIDMAGVNFPGHDASRSLFSKQWHYRPRIVNRPAQLDIDRARFTKTCGVVYR